MNKGKRSVIVMIVISLFAAVFSGCASSNVGAGSNPEVSPVELPMADYVNGWYNKSPAQMGRGIHRDLAKRNPDPSGSGILQEMGKNKLMELAGLYGGTGGSGRRLEIEVFEEYNGMAIARVRSNLWVDYVNLIYQDGKWWIINVLWEDNKPEVRELTPELTEAIEKPIYDYVEGWYDKDTERMKQGLHSNLVKRHLNPESRNGIDEFTLESLLQAVPEYGGVTGDERLIDIEILDVQNDIAAAKVVSNDYVDYISLCYLDGQWWIVNVIWEFKQS